MRERQDLDREVRTQALGRSFPGGGKRAGDERGSLSWVRRAEEAGSHPGARLGSETERPTS